ncbi:MAG TPA: RNA-binding protein, partial [Flavobacteriaceae bacterium]|nr:RNA-binding protein [Flavobacteriaceae bacterium]
NFGIGNSEEVKRIGVIWPDGKISEIGNTKSNQLVTIDYNKAKTGNLSFETTRLKKKAINPIDLGINYKHVENTFDDYALQLLIPQKQSSKGTKMTVGDVNGDGLEDFFVG